LAAAKNREFRERMVGRTISAVSLHEPGAALSDNYLKITLAGQYEPNRLIDVTVSGLTDSGVYGRVR
jgi:hypothetical protein